eukprot:s1751_g11.t1
MLSLASRRCWAVLAARLPSRSFALVAGRQVDAEELQRLVEEARRPRKQGPRPLTQAPNCSRLADEAASDVVAGGFPEELDYPTILRCKVQKLVADGRYRSKLRGTRCDLDGDFLFKLIQEQQGMCAYSGMPLELVIPHSDWRISLERLDNKRGYLRDNVTLIAHEFNSVAGTSKKTALQGSAQWSKWKVERLPLERAVNVDLKALRRRIELATGSQNICGNGAATRMEDGDDSEQGRLPCLRCGAWKPLDQFSANWRRTKHFPCYCKACFPQYTETVGKATLRGHALELIRSARQRHRNGKQRQGDFELELDEVLGMLWAQRGRCFYSDVPLRYAQSNVDWLMSLERLDNTKTYTRENTCIVALEFNTSAQWSREKVQLVWGNMLGDQDTPDFPEIPPDFSSSFRCVVPSHAASDILSVAD